MTDTAQDGSSAGVPLAGYEAYLGEAVRTADWQWRRGESFERRAGTILGFVGVVLPLLVLPGERAATADGVLGTIAVVLLAVAAVLLLGTAVQAGRVLLARTYPAPALSQLRRRWKTFRDGARQSPAEIVGSFAERLIVGDGDASPLEALADDASVRGRRLSWAVRLLVAGVVTIAIAVSVLIVEGAL